MSHGDEALELPSGFELTAKTSHAVAGIQNVAQKWYAVQFHPEVHHTRNGTEILRNFVFRICGAEAIVDAAALYRLDDRAGEASGGQRARDLRAFGWRGFVGCGGAGGSRAARCEREVAADLHLREQRCAAQERVRESAADTARQAGPAPRCSRRYGSLSGQAQGRERSGEEAKNYRQRIHRGV